MAEQSASSQGDEAREAQWAADRLQQDAPLPHADQRHYKDEGERQTDLAAAERGNIATAAGALGLTTAQWSALRSDLGRSPTRGDVRRAS